MFIVKAYHPPDKTPRSESESGPFDTRDDANRFAIGLAKTGLAYRCEIKLIDPTKLNETITRDPSEAIDKEITP